jgi:hypothetical protein
MLETTPNPRNESAIEAEAGKEAHTTASGLVARMNAGLDPSSLPPNDWKFESKLEDGSARNITIRQLESGSVALDIYRGTSYLGEGITRESIEIDGTGSVTAASATNISRRNGERQVAPPTAPYVVDALRGIVDPTPSEAVARLVQAMEQNVPDYRPALSSAYNVQNHRLTSEQFEEAVVALAIGLRTAEKLQSSEDPKSRFAGDVCEKAILVVAEEVFRRNDSEESGRFELADLPSRETFGSPEK